MFLQVVDMVLDDLKKEHPDAISVVCVGVFGPPASKFVFARLTRMVCSEDTRVYTGSDGMSLRPVRCCSCY